MSGKVLRRGIRGKIVFEKRRVRDDKIEFLRETKIPRVSQVGLYPAFPRTLSDILLQLAERVRVYFNALYPAPMSLGQHQH